MSLLEKMIMKEFDSGLKISSHCVFGKNSPKNYYEICYPNGEISRIYQNELSEEEGDLLSEYATLSFERDHGIKTKRKEKMYNAIRSMEDDQIHELLGNIVSQSGSVKDGLSSVEEVVFEIIFGEDL